MRKKRLLIISIALILVLPSFFVSATANDHSSDAEANKLEGSGEITSKDEVVYASLSPTGDLDSIYVVNILDIAKEGIVEDYGTYSSVKNLTNLSVLEQSNNTVQLEATEGNFYYQGNMEQGNLPWDIDVLYTLDGNERDPMELAGENGHLKLNIYTSANEKVDPSFYENFMLQVSLELDSEVYSNIDAPDASIANVGKNQQITYTVMPAKDGELVLEADVKDFELNGIDIAAIPSTMSVDTPDVDEMTEDMDSLADAIEQLNDGVYDLKTGVSELNDGVGSLKDGSKQYKDGLNEVDASSAELVEASEMIGEALQFMNSSLNSDSEEEMDLSQLEDLTGVLSQLSDGMLTMSEELTPLKEGFSEAYEQLTMAINNIPDIPAEALMEVQEKYSNDDSVLLLLDAYEKAQIVKGAFNGTSDIPGIKEVFDQIEPALEGVIENSSNMGETLGAISEGLSSSMESLGAIEELGKGMEELSTNYSDFHSGLVSYTEGISELASSYEELHGGISDISSGTSELDDGVEELHDGTKELHASTKDMPDEMEKEIDEMMAEYDKSDYEPISFVSEKNTNVNSVQFIIRTESIKMDEEVEVEEEVVKEEKKSFWTLLLDLFR